MAEPERAMRLEISEVAKRLWVGRIRYLGFRLSQASSSAKWQGISNK
jgi:hypothetical protein